MWMNYSCWIVSQLIEKVSEISANIATPLQTKTIVADEVPNYFSATFYFSSYFIHILRLKFWILLKSITLALFGIFPCGTICIRVLFTICSHRNVRKKYCWMWNRSVMPFKLGNAIRVAWIRLSARTQQLSNSIISVSLSEYVNFKIWSIFNGWAELFNWGPIFV